MNKSLIEGPFKYLGISVREMQEKNVEPKVEKMKKNLTWWKGRLLSFAGIVCIPKVVLPSILLYYISLCKT